MVGRRSPLFVLIRVELRPAALEEAPHGVASHPHLRRVLVEQLAVVEDELGVGRKLLAAAVAETGGRKPSRFLTLTLKCAEVDECNNLVTIIQNR